MAKQAAKIIPQHQTLEVFSSKPSNGTHDSEGYKKSYYNGSIARPKDMSALKVKSAGVHKDSAQSVK